MFWWSNIVGLKLVEILIILSLIKRTGIALGALGDSVLELSNFGKLGCFGNWNQLKEEKKLGKYLVSWKCWLRFYLLVGANWECLGNQM